MFAESLGRLRGHKVYAFFFSMLIPTPECESNVSTLLRCHSWEKDGVRVQMSRASYPRSHVTGAGRLALCGKKKKRSGITPN